MSTIVELEVKRCFTSLVRCAFEDYNCIYFSAVYLDLAYEIM